MKRVWNFLGDIRISFVLLISASVVLYLGSVYANHHFAFFRALNEIRVQDWLTEHIPVHVELAWWVPVLFVVMGLLGLNTFICACNRVSELIPRRGAMPQILFLHKLTPSIVHFLFLVIMAGHLITFTMGKWDRFPIEEGSVVTVGKETFLTVQSVQNRYFPEESKMRERISQTEVVLLDAQKNEIKIEYTKPAFVNGACLHLDRVKIRKKDEVKKRLIEKSGNDEETCNKANVYHDKKAMKQNPNPQILIVSDPGLYIIISGLTLIMGLMSWYFIFKERTG